MKRNRISPRIAAVGVLLALSSAAHSQEKKKAEPEPKEPAGEVEEFEKKVKQQIEKRIVKEAKEAAAGVPLPPGLVIIVEFIEVEQADFCDWLLENPVTTDATPLRMEVQEWVRAGKAKIFDTAVVHARSGQRAKVEAIRESVYPTEYDPPGAAAMGIEGKNEKGEVVELIPPNAAAFETRNVGTTLEVDPVLGADGETVDLNLAPEIVQADENSEHITVLGDTEMVVTMPRFLTSKVTTQVAVRAGDYAFLGSSRLGKPGLRDAEDPILLFFVRCDVSGE